MNTINDEYKVAEITCSRCKKELKKEDFKSIFEGELHYKTTKCSCGKENTIQVMFLGSGGDDWEGHIERGRAEVESIEKKVQDMET